MPQEVPLSFIALSELAAIAPHLLWKVCHIFIYTGGWCAMFSGRAVQARVCPSREPPSARRAPRCGGARAIRTQLATGLDCPDAGLHLPFT